MQKKYVILKNLLNRCINPTWSFAGHFRVVLVNWKAPHTCIKVCSYFRSLTIKYRHGKNKKIKELKPFSLTSWSDSHKESCNFLILFTETLRQISTLNSENCFYYLQPRNPTTLFPKCLLGQGCILILTFSKLEVKCSIWYLICVGDKNCTRI